MKRYTLKTKEERIEFDMGHKMEIRRTYAIEPSETGELVLWSEVQEVIKGLENRIPEIRIERLQKQLALAVKGCCPECGEKVQGWKGPSGFFGPEMAASITESGRDTSTGHKLSCSRRHQA